MTLEAVEVAANGLVFDGLAAGPAGGPLVLFLHGFPQSGWQWRAQLAALGEAGWRAVAPDQRGYSPRARPPAVDDYRMDRLAADALALADALGADGFHLVGHDWGAAVAWLVASLHPDRVRSLTAVSVPHPFALAEALASPTGDQAARSAYIRFFQQPELAERFLLEGECSGLRALFANTAHPDRAAVERYVADLCDPAALTAALNWYRALDPQALFGIGPTAVPTLYVWSTDDPALGREGAEACCRYVGGPYRFEVLEGVGHWIPEEVPDALNRLLLEHLGPATPQ
jgi:pimeloyl-ACP methyl ester carboxylesterase